MFGLQYRAISNCRTTVGEVQCKKLAVRDSIDSLHGRVCSLTRLSRRPIFEIPKETVQPLRQ